MKYGEEAGADHRKNRHGFGGAVDAHSPALAEEQQDCRDQRTGMADTDPPHEVGYVPSPSYRAVQVPEPDPEPYLGEDAQHAQGHHRGADGHRDKPRPRRPGFHRAADVFRDLVIVLPAVNEGVSDF